MKKNMTRVFAAVLAVMMLALPAFAEQFTPSVEQKGAPASPPSPTARVSRSLPSSMTRTARKLPASPWRIWW